MSIIIPNLLFMLSGDVGVYVHLLDLVMGLVDLVTSQPCSQKQLALL